MIRNTLIALATIVATASVFSAPAQAGGWHKKQYHHVKHHKVCHIKKKKVFAGYDECGNKLWVWKRIRHCH
ncbi:hypothetical protein [Jiella marina]|uniref:hypothetical protein n=1 Tax=Jiella sp. LLJ827 TaxID=2917712 RepID=UPI0021018754|nr:hypothetical protein [Jiella sp. LLJ827]MCQ0989446.1 hypothetical protein [Jiella sp. LLJ827]